MLVLTIVPIHFAVMISPGPNFVLLSSTALSIGRRAGIRAALGIAVGSLIWMTAAAVGVTAILEALPILGIILKILGGLYLIHLGFHLWRSKGVVNAAPTMTLGPGMDHGFRQGLIVNLTSSKSAAYFGSIFAAFLTHDVALLVLFSLILCLFCMSVIWHVALATAFSAEKIRRPYLQFAETINKVAGAVLTVLGIRMILTAHR